jgi:hypothetical protein
MIEKFCERKKKQIESSVIDTIKTLTEANGEHCVEVVNISKRSFTGI